MRATPDSSSRSMRTRPSLTVSPPGSRGLVGPRASYGITSRCFHHGSGDLLMDFRLDDGQLELQQTVARFCADRCPLDAVGAREGAPTDRACWKEMAELGMFGLLVHDEDGGSGLGVVEGAILFEQLGSYLAPGPVLWTVLAAPLVE